MMKMNFFYGIIYNIKYISNIQSYHFFFVSTFLCCYVLGRKEKEHVWKWINFIWCIAVVFFMFSTLKKIHHVHSAFHCNIQCIKYIVVICFEDLLFNWEKYFQHKEIYEMLRKLSSFIHKIYLMRWFLPYCALVGGLNANFCIVDDIISTHF